MARSQGLVSENAIPKPSIALMISGTPASFAAIEPYKTDLIVKKCTISGLCLRNTPNRRMMVANSTSGLVPLRCRGNASHLKPAYSSRALYSPGGERRITSYPSERRDSARVKRKLYRYQSVFANNKTLTKQPREPR